MPAMRILVSRCVVLGLGLCLAPAASAQQKGTKPAPAPPAEAAEAETEEAMPAGAAPGAGAPYRGVAPDGGKVRPPNAPRKKNPVRVTWTGFQMKPDGGSRVFVQLTSEAPYQVTDMPGGVKVVIKGARLHLHNNGRPLNTQYFASPVKSV